MTVAYNNIILFLFFFFVDASKKSVKFPKIVTFLRAFGPLFQTGHVYYVRMRLHNKTHHSPGKAWAISIYADIITNADSERKTERVVFVIVSQRTQTERFRLIIISFSRVIITILLFLPDEKQCRLWLTMVFFQGFSNAR